MSINFFAEPLAYTSMYYQSVFNAASGVAFPFLVQQKNEVVEGAIVTGNQVAYGGNEFTVHTVYINPGPGYYTKTPLAFQNVWPNAQFPNAVFVYDAGTFLATLDCVGFGSRVLVATGDDLPGSNAYCLFHGQVDYNAIHFAALGIVPTAMEFSIAIPVLTQGRWSYVAGGMNVDLIQSQPNQEGKTYTGVPKSGFSTAQAGDIVCLGYVDAKSNGHFMVLTTTPQPVQLNTFAEMNLPAFVTNAYEISVYDSTDSGSSLHFNDSRLNDNDSGSGVGFGQLYFFTDSSDQPVGFIFGPTPSGGMEPAHFIYGMVPVVPNQLEVAAISVGRFQ